MKVEFIETKYFACTTVEKLDWSSCWKTQTIYCTEFGERKLSFVPLEWCWILKLSQVLIAFRRNSSALCSSCIVFHIPCSFHIPVSNRTHFIANSQTPLLVTETNECACCIAQQTITVHPIWCDIKQHTLNFDFFWCNNNFSCDSFFWSLYFGLSKH